MKNKLIILFSVVFFGFVSCVKEPALENSITTSFYYEDPTTNELVPLAFDAVNNYYIAPIDTNIVADLSKVEGEFVSVYKGTVGNTYDEYPTSNGTAVKVGTNFTASYPLDGLYKFTVVASSSGNWSSDFESTSKSYDLKVFDYRTGLKFFSLRNTSNVWIPGVIEGDKIKFQASQLYDITKQKPQWETASLRAIVYIGDVVQTSGNKGYPIDFSAGPVVYTVVSPSGARFDYTIVLE